MAVDAEVFRTRRVVFSPFPELYACQVLTRPSLDSGWMLAAAIVGKSQVQKFGDEVGSDTAMNLPDGAIGVRLRLEHMVFDQVDDVLWIYATRRKFLFFEPASGHPCRDDLMTEKNDPLVGRMLAGRSRFTGVVKKGGEEVLGLRGSQCFRPSVPHRVRAWCGQTRRRPVVYPALYP